MNIEEIQKEIEGIFILVLELREEMDILSRRVIRALALINELPDAED